MEGGHGVSDLKIEMPLQKKEDHKEKQERRNNEFKKKLKAKYKKMVVRQGGELVEYQSRRKGSPAHSRKHIHLEDDQMEEDSGRVELVDASQQLNYTVSNLAPGLVSSIEGHHYQTA